MKKWKKTKKRKRKRKIINNRFILDFKKIYLFFYLKKNYCINKFYY